MEETHYEMLWDCEYCGTDKLLGVSQKFCPNCGSAQNAEKRYFPKDDEKVAVADHDHGYQAGSAAKRRVKAERCIVPHRRTEETSKRKNCQPRYQAGFAHRHRLCNRRRTGHVEAFLGCDDVMGTTISPASA